MVSWEVLEGLACGLGTDIIDVPRPQSVCSTYFPSNNVTVQVTLKVTVNVTITVTAKTAHLQDLCHVFCSKGCPAREHLKAHHPRTPHIHFAIIARPVSGLFG
jgi:hypothetical protein